jgi:hypothetical protein
MVHGTVFDWGSGRLARGVWHIQSDPAAQLRAGDHVFWFLNPEITHPAVRQKIGKSKSTAAEKAKTTIKTLLIRTKNTIGD